MNKDADTRHDDDCGIEDNGKPGDQMKKGAGIGTTLKYYFKNFFFLSISPMKNLLFIYLFRQEIR